MGEDIIIVVQEAIKCRIVIVVEDCFVAFSRFLSDEFMKAVDCFFGIVVRVFGNESMGLFLSNFPN